jgi:hypothetical protein
MNQVIDLTGVQYLDSNQLQDLVRAYRHGTKIQLVNVSPSLQALLDLTRLHAIFEIVEAPPESTYLKITDITKRQDSFCLGCFAGAIYALTIILVSWPS